MTDQYCRYSDQELVVLLNTGDEHSFAEIFTRYQSLLFHFAYKKIKDKDEAQDIVQDIFVSLWDNREGLELHTSLRSYLYRSVLNKVLNGVKHNLVREVYVNSLQHMIDQSAPSADYRVREKDIEELLNLEIAALPRQMREVFLLRKEQFLTNKQVAEQLDLSVQTVETHMKRALKVLKKRLAYLSYFFSLF